MSKFKISGVGIDLRKVSGELSTAAFESLTPDTPPLKLNYVFIDLLHPSPHLTYSVIESVIVNGGVLMVYIDLGKFDKKIDPWIRSYELWKEWKDSYWGIPLANSPTILFENLPDYKEEWIGWKEWNSSEHFNIGVVFSNQEKWEEEKNLWMRWFGKAPGIVARPLSPLFYNHDLEEWIKLGDPITIGLEWDGGEEGILTLKEIFGDTYLMGFASYHSQIILSPIYNSFSPEDRRRCEWLKDIIGKDILENEGEKFELKKNISRLPKSPKKLVYESFKLPIGNETWILPTKDSDILYPYTDLVYSFSKPKIEITTLPGGENYKLSEIELKIKEEIENSLYPIPETKETAWTMILLTVSDFLSKEFKSSERWELEFCGMGEYIMAINALRIKKKNWLTKHLPDEIEEQKSFLLVMKSPESVYFIDIESLENNEKEEEKKQ